MLAAAGAFIRGEPRIKHQRRISRLPESGLTGMGFQTQRHFIEVKNRMEHYVDEQEALEYDDIDLHPRHRRNFISRIFADGNKAPKPESQSSTPVSSQEQLVRDGIATPLSSRKQVVQHRSTTPLPSRKQSVHNGLSAPPSLQKQVAHHGSSTSLSSRNQAVHHGFATPLASRRGGKIH